MPHEQLLWQPPGYLVNFCDARGEHSKGRGSLLFFSPLLYACARVLEISPFALKKLACEALVGSGGRGGGEFGFQVCFRLVKLLKNNSFFSKFELPTVESLLNGHLGTDGEMDVEKKFK